ncbi:MAG: M3 family oligoendopeptidase [Candidatus Omnitrophica bacterium]|nr:M3 family oligoendopeptidase [Candidatus Omnitrophota bacterium]
MANQTAAGISWDLSDLYASPDDPRIAEDLKSAEEAAIRFETSYRPPLEALSSSGADTNTAPETLASLLREYKAIVEPLTRVVVFSHLRFAEKTDEPARGAFLQKIRDRVTDIEQHLIFWHVLWCRADKEGVRRLVQNPQLAGDAHYLESVRKFAPFTLSEAEEKILSVKANTSGAAFSRLFDEIVNNISFKLIENGKETAKTESEVLALLHSPDRDKRRAAAGSLADGMKANTRVIVFIYNMILADHRAVMKLRSYEHPMDARNLDNETDRETVMGLIRSVKAGYPLASRYYDLKQRLLKLDVLRDYDRSAPLEKDEQVYSFDDCKRITLEAYGAFSEESARIAGMFFERRWIDAEMRPAKQSGGFSCATTPDCHPSILVNFAGNIRDVGTVAHELGHGIHQYLARQAGILEADAPLTMAETASVFGEILTTEKLLSTLKEPRRRLGLIMNQIDDQFATVFRQIALTDFELKSHEAGLKNGELSEEALNGFWITSNTELYGQSAELTENYRHSWKYIPHFIHTPFYCYAYSFAQLFVLALYQKYKENPAGFVPAYLEMLSAGGSKKPEELARIMGLELRDPGFWQTGLKLLANLVGEAESLAADMGV